MIVTMQAGATLKEITGVIKLLETFGATPSISRDCGNTLVTAPNSRLPIDAQQLRALPGVTDVHEDVHPFKRVSRDYHPDNTVVEVKGVKFGDGSFPIIAGPCAVETEAQIHDAAKNVASRGAQVLRGGAYKPRTSPYAFQGLGEPGLKMMSEAGRAHRLATVSEVMSIHQIEPVARYIDILQIGARNMQNYSLLKTVGKLGKPVLLKRGMAATIQDLLLSAEYILAEGNGQVILCERGLRSFDTTSRNLFDLTAIPVVQQLSHLPMVADPSHGTGRRDKVLPMARAAIAAGADGILIEVHPQPEKALSDGAQSLTPDGFADVVKQLRAVATAIGRRIAPGGAS